MEKEPDIKSMIRMTIVHDSQIEMLDKIFTYLKCLYVKDGESYRLGEVRQPGYFIEYYKSHKMHPLDIDYYPLEVGDVIYFEFYDDKINKRFESKGLGNYENRT